MWQLEKFGTFNTILQKSTPLLHVTRHWGCHCRCKDGDCLRKLQFVSIQWDIVTFIDLLALCLHIICLKRQSLRCIILFLER